MKGSAVAECLVKQGYVQVNLEHPFTYVSGLQGPIYCDNRQIWSELADRQLVLQGMLDLIKTTFAPQDLAKAKIVGMATGGIPLATLVADRLNLPLAYIRGQKKGHGQGRRLEGRVQSGDQVILVEDLINQGSSIISAITELQQEQIKVLGVMAIVNYQMPAALEKFKDYNFPIKALAGFGDLQQAFLANHFMAPDQQTALDQWHAHPEQWPLHP